MRIVALIFGILGALASGFLGAKWLSDLNANAELLQLADALGHSTSGIRTSAYLLLALAVPLGIAGGVLALRGKGKIGAPVMLVGAIAPGIFEARAFVFTAPLFLGALFALLSKPKTA